MTVGSLFAGIGGIDLGLERAGMQVKWQVENNPYCVRVLEKHWPRVKRYGDIRAIDWSKVGPVDLVCGGFPCQPVSVAGARKGDKDERWLWPEFLRAIREVRPRYALVENVPGLLSTSGISATFGSDKERRRAKGRLARRVFGDLAEIGYDAEWSVVSAQDVGAPHRRQRIFIVAYPIDPRGRTESLRIFRSSDAPLFRDDGEEESLEDSRQPSGDEGAEVERGIDGILEEWNALHQPSGPGEAPRDVPDSECEGFIPQYQPQARQIARYSGFEQQWAVEPDVGRVAHGVPSRVDRLKCLGNAVVPQVAEYIGRQIIESEGQGGEG